MNPTLFPASVVGSLPRPRFVIDLLEHRRQHSIGDQEFHKQIDAAVAFAIAMQEAAGLDVVTDGEWRRWSYIGIIAEICHGFGFEFREGRSWHTVVAPLTPAAPGVAAREARFVRAHTNRKVKVCLPSPYLLGQRMWDESKSRSAYPTRESFMRALVPYLREELRLAREAGADIVQFDDPHICLFVDPEVQKRFANWQSEIGLAVELLNEIVDGVNGVSVALHL